MLNFSDFIGVSTILIHFHDFEQDLGTHIYKRAMTTESATRRHFVEFYQDAVFLSMPKFVFLRVELLKPQIEHQQSKQFEIFQIMTIDKLYEHSKRALGTVNSSVGRFHGSKD